MTKEELLKLMRLLSALEAVLMFKSPVPDYLHDQLADAVLVLEREIFK